jgi:hypothetical protein
MMRQEFSGCPYLLSSYRCHYGVDCISFLGLACVHALYLLNNQGSGRDGGRRGHVVGALPNDVRQGRDEARA